MVYSYVEFLYTITWAFCIVRLFNYGQCEGLRVVGWARKNPTFPFYRGLTTISNNFWLGVHQIRMRLKVSEEL